MPEIKYHIFVCNSEHSKQKNGHFCHEKDAGHLLDRFTKKIQEAGVTEEVMLKASACMNQCINGITVKVFPGNIIYGKVEVSDLDEIIESHLKNGIPVQRLRLSVRTSFWE
ncbi:MAG: (2Fe-2S) ferredoxin domain-containing protein [Bacteroidia bacterium]|nr:(2Fe-2S) ferredoxin domain-containing protein [Bacteroidia bacterium]